MSNRPTIAQAVQMPVKEVAELPIEILALLLEDVAELKAAHKRADDHIFAAMSHRFSDRAAGARKAKGIDTGSVRLQDGDYVIIADLPKKPTWNQDGLREVEQSLHEMGEPTEEYISTKREVSERAYGAWPSSIRTMFEPHRILGVGKASFKLELKRGVA